MLIEVDNFKVVNPIKQTRPKLVKRHSVDQPVPAAGAGRRTLKAWRAERGKAMRPMVEARMVAERDVKRDISRAHDKREMDKWLAHHHQGQKPITAGTAPPLRHRPGFGHVFRNTK